MMIRLLQLNQRKKFQWIFALILFWVLLVSGSHWEGHVLGDLFFLAGIIGIGISMVGRIWCLIYISGYKTNMLISSGPYSICRNPLYFFSLLGAMGIGLATKTMAIPLVIIIGFFLYYPRVIQREERHLSTLFNGQFIEYLNRTPRLLPKMTLLEEPDEYLVKPRVIRKNMLDNLWFIWIIGILELIAALHRYEIIPVMFRWI